MALPDDSSPPWRLGTSNHSLNRFASLLGTFELKEDAEEAKKPVQTALVPNHDALNKLLVSGKSVGAEDCALSFPSLSLMEEDHHAAVGSDKHELQARAALNLSRPLRVTRENCSLPEVSSTNSYVESSYDALAADNDSRVGSVTEVPSMMLKNLAGSFALLVDARLRAYATILARHGVALAESSEVPEDHKEEATCAVERKLASLLDVGSRMTINNMVTNFHSRPTLGMSSCVGDAVEAIMIPLVMSALLDITIPKVNSGHERVTVSLQASGVISGTSCETNFCSVVCFRSRSAHRTLIGVILRCVRNGICFTQVSPLRAGYQPAHVVHGPEGSESELDRSGSCQPSKLPR